MSSKAISGVGTIFRRWNPLKEGSNKWENLSEITAITGPDKSRQTIDVTNLDSTGGYSEFIASFRDGGTVQLKMNFTRATFTLMNDDFEDNDRQNYEIILPDDERTTIEFEGLVTNISMDISLTDKITADTTIKVSGKPTVNSGASSGL
jgi:predicted secreted protein